MQYDFSNEPKTLDAEVKKAFLEAISDIPQVLEVYTKYIPDDDDPTDDVINLYVVMEEMHITAHGEVADAENDIIDSLPEDYRYRYEFLRLFKKDGQVERIVEEEGLEKIYP
jgi:hypothetical protein